MQADRQVDMQKTVAKTDSQKVKEAYKQNIKRMKKRDTGMQAVGHKAQAGRKHVYGHEKNSRKDRQAGRPQPDMQTSRQK
jgi:uncharacterized protein